MSRDIKLSLIDRDENQPRSHFDQAGLDELAQSIDANGLAVPILVRPVGERFVIVHGERRYRAVTSLGWETISAEVRDIPPDEAQWLSLIENIQRADLSPIEEAQAFKQHLSDGLKQAELGERVGKSQSYIAQKLRLLKMPEPLMFLLDKGKLTEGHARQLMKLKNIYPKGVTVSFDGMNTSSHDAKELTNDEMIEVMRSDPCYPFALIYVTRPMDNPPMMPGKLAVECPEYITDVSVKFIEYVIECDNEPEAWTVAAWWWGVMVAHYELSVADFSKAISNFEDALYANLFAWVFMNRKKPPVNDGEGGFRFDLAHLRYWGRRSDLMRAGLLDWANDNEDEVKEFIADNETHMKKVMSSGSVIEPSSCQSWGSANEKYQELRNKEIEHEVY